MAQPLLPDDLRRYVEANAAAVGVSIAPEDLPAVLGIFANLARVASALMAFPLPEKIESASVFTAGRTRQ